MLDVLFYENSTDSIIAKFVKSAGIGLDGLEQEI